MTPAEITAWRKERGLLMKQFGELLGVSESGVYRWESGNRPAPRMLRLALIGLDATVEMKKPATPETE